MTITETAIVPFEAENHNVVVAKNQALMDLRSAVFQVGVHYGEAFKGAGKPTLLKPGAEMILERFKLWPRFIDRSMVEIWDPDKPVFHYRYECQLVRRDTGEVWGAGIGSCNSMEDKYRWRNQSRLCPQCGAEKIIKSKYPDRKTGDIGWYCLACKASFASTDPRIVNQEVGRVPNDEVFTLVNTIDKMAQKRALIAATLNATGASTYFTQDVEDFPGYAGKVIEIDTPEIIEGDFTEPHAHDPQTGEVKRDPAPKVLLDPVRAVENMVDEMDALEMENSRLAVSDLDAHFGKKEEQPKRASKPRKVQTAPPATNGGNASLIALRDKIWPNWAGQTVPYSKTILELENMKINWTGHFWAGVKDGLGWQEQDVYTALGKDSLHDVSGSFGDICLLLVMKMPEAQSAPVGEAS